MSQYSLFDEDNPKPPQAPPLNITTLLLIQINNFLPAQNHGNNHLDHLHSHQCRLHDHRPPNLQEQPSLDLKCQQANQQSVKKKKGGCTCKKTKCLKMYCQCFASGKLCAQDCSCTGCHNNQANLAQVARAQQIIKLKQTNGRRQIFAGCTCRKTKCLKKYCQCFNRGVVCGPQCKCQDCANLDPSQPNEPGDKKQSVASTKQMIASEFLLKPTH